MQGRANGSLNGKDGKTTTGIAPEQLSPQVFDYIFLEGQYPGDCGIEECRLKGKVNFCSVLGIILAGCSQYFKECLLTIYVFPELKDEFNYWYPFDLRVSGKVSWRNFW